MRVPTRINPQTAPTVARQPYLQAQGADWSGLARGVQGLAGDIREGQLKREEFDLNSEFVKHTNRRRLAFEERARVADPGAAGFTERLVADYEDEDRALVQRYKDLGYDEGNVRRFELQLGQLRGTLTGQALTFQGMSARVHESKQVSELGTQLSQYASAQPDAVGSTLDELEHNVNLLQNLTAPEREEILQRERPGIIMAAGQGLARLRPLEVIQKLHPEFLKPQAATGGRSSNPWANVAVDVANEFGLNPVELAAIMSFESGLDPNRENPTGHLGLIQFGKTEQAQYGITKGSTPEQWTKAISQFFNDRGLQKGADIEDVYSTILTGSPGNYDRMDSNGTTVRNAVPRIIRDHLAKASEWLGPMEQAAEAAAEPVKGISPDGKTGILALDLMDAQQRAQVLAWAKNNYQQDDAELKAKVQHKVESRLTGLQEVGQSAVVITDAEGEAAYGAKWPEVKGQLAAAEAAGPVVSGMKTASAAQIETQVQALYPTNTADPAYPEKLAVYNATAQAAQQELALRERDPAVAVIRAFPNVGQRLEAAKTPQERQAAYLAMSKAYEKLGIPEARRFPLSDAESTRIGQAYDGMPANQRLASLDQWFGELAGTGMAKAFGAQLMADGASALGTEAFLYSILRPYPNSDKVLLEAFKGGRAMREDAAQRPSDEALIKGYRKAVGSAISGINPAASSRWQQAAAAIYVARGGQTVRGDIQDLPLYQKALRIAVGGNEDDDTSGIVKFHGSDAATILPPGINKKQWNDWLAGRTPGSLTAISTERLPPLTGNKTPVTLQDIIDEGVFVLLAPGRYGIRLNDMGFLKTATGNTYEVNISPQTVRGR